MSNVPGIYAEGIPVLLEDFAAGRNDREIIPAMQQGHHYGTAFFSAAHGSF